MDVMGEALAIDRAAMLRLASEAEVSSENAARVIERICAVASRFEEVANSVCPEAITRDTLRFIKSRIDENVAMLG